MPVAEPMKRYGELMAEVLNIPEKAGLKWVPRHVFLRLSFRAVFLPHQRVGFPPFLWLSFSPFCI